MTAFSQSKSIHHGRVIFSTKYRDFREQYNPSIFQRTSCARCWDFAKLNLTPNFVKKGVSKKLQKYRKKLQLDCVKLHWNENPNHFTDRQGNWSFCEKREMTGFWSFFWPRIFSKLPLPGPRPRPPHFWPQVSVWFLSSHLVKRFFLFFFKWEIWTASKAKSTSTLFGLILEKSKKIGSFCKTRFFLQFPSVWAKAGPSQGGQRIFKDYFFVTKFWGQNFGEIRSFPKFDCIFSVKVNTPWTCNIFHKI